MTPIRRRIAKAVAANLRAYRTEKGMSQETLARAIGKSRETIRAAEAAEGVPQWETLDSLAKALKINLWDLLVDPSFRGDGQDPGLFGYTSYSEGIRVLSPDIGKEASDLPKAA